ncbi:hypothetical protein ACF1AY_09355 [Streptomyces sp. NPDC014776]|uniref:hypothetical protein n=1 Tax=Streptomyces sp. NPDC014776 TaxID=3364909 RepID=UPI0036F639C9
MADLFELTLSVGLRDGLSDQERAELCWHLGTGPEPGTLRIVTEFPLVVVDDDGVPVVENHPEPLLAGHGEAFRVGGVLHSALVREGGGWTLTSRQEIHPDGFAGLGDLLVWLAARAADRHRRPDGSVELGGIRAYEDTRARPLLVRDGSVTWPS